MDRESGFGATGALICALSSLLLIAAISLLAAGTAAAGERRAATPAPVPEAPPNFFGVSGRNLKLADVPRMQAAGVRTYRTLFHFRNAKRREDGFYNWNAFDRLVERSARSGIELLPLLYGTPDWIGSDEAAPPIGDAEAEAEWTRLLSELVSRYGPGGLFWTLHPFLPRRPIRTWQIWNEPNLNKYWHPAPDPDAYARLLTISARALKAVDPGARVIAAGVLADPHGVGIPGPEYLAALVSSPQARAAADRFAYHPYGERVSDVRRHLVRARKAVYRNGGRNTPLWVTEVGWGTEPLVSQLLSKPGEQAQADALSRTFKMLLRRRQQLGIERVLWYYWRDQYDPLCLWCRSAGLLRNTLQLKPAFGAFKALAKPSP